MFAVIFEVDPKEAHRDEYFDLARMLKPKLEAIDGFIDIDRFASRRSKARVLSLSTWRDEKAVIRWRTQAEHRRAQERGRREIFADYRLRVGEITADTQSPEGVSVTQRRFDQSEIADAKVATVTEVTVNAHGLAAGALSAADLRLDGDAEGLLDHEVFASIYHPGKLVLLASWRDAEAAAKWIPARPAAAAAFRHRRVRIIRDYGMFERREAPQRYPDVTAAG
jgi:heme-degrading monooxygenase HmoA